MELLIFTANQTGNKNYVQWRNFENVVKKGMLSCKNNGIRVEDHFAGVSKMVTLGVLQILLTFLLSCDNMCSVLHN